MEATRTLQQGYGARRDGGDQGWSHAGSGYRGPSQQSSKVGTKGGTEGPYASTKPRAAAEAKGLGTAHGGSQRQGMGHPGQAFSTSDSSTSASTSQRPLDASSQPIGNANVRAPQLLFPTRAGVKTRASVQRAAASTAPRAPMVPVHMNGPGESGARSTIKQRTAAADPSRSGPTLPLKIAKRPAPTPDVTPKLPPPAARSADPSSSSSPLLDGPSSSPAFGTLPNTSWQYGASSSESTSRHRKGPSNATAAMSAASSSSPSLHSTDAFGSDTASDHSSATSPLTHSSSGLHQPGPIASSSSRGLADDWASQTARQREPKTGPRPQSPASRHSSLSSDSRPFLSSGLPTPQPDAGSLDFDFGLFSADTPSLDLASTLGAALSASPPHSATVRKPDAFVSSTASPRHRLPGDGDASSEADGYSQHSRRDTVTSFSDLLKRSTNRASKRMTLRAGHSPALSTGAFSTSGSEGSRSRTESEASTTSSRAAAPTPQLHSREPSAGRLSRKPVPLLLDLEISGAGPSMASPIGRGSSDGSHADDDEDEAETPVAPRRPLPPSRSLTPSSLRSEGSARQLRPSNGLHSRQLSDASSFLSSNKDLPPTPTSAYSMDSLASSTHSTQPHFLKRSLSRFKSSRPSPSPSPSMPYAHSYMASSSNLSASAGSSFTSLNSSVSSKASNVSRIKKFMNKVKGAGSANGQVSTVGPEPPLRHPPETSRNRTTPRSRRKPSLSNLLGVIAPDDRRSPSGSSDIASRAGGGEPAPTGRRSFDMLRPTFGKRKTDDALVIASEESASTRAKAGQGSAPTPADAPTLMGRRSFDVLRSKLATGRKSMDELSAVRPSASGQLASAGPSKESERNFQGNASNTPAFTSRLHPPVDARSTANVRPKSPSFGNHLAATATVPAPARPTSPAFVNGHARDGVPKSSSSKSEVPALAMVSLSSQPRILDDLSADTWNDLERALLASSTPSPQTDRAGKLAVLTNTLLPHLKAEEGFRTAKYQSQTNAERHRRILFNWLDWTLEELRQAQPASRGACLEAIASILESHFMSVANLGSPAATRQYSQALVHVLKFAVDKLNDKAVYANTLVFSGRMMALAFFRLEGVGLKLLRALPAVKRTSMKRILNEVDAGGDKTSRPNTTFPRHLDSLCFEGNLAAYCSRFTSRPEEEPGTLLDDCGVEIEMSGNWLIRWTASDSDLPFAFLRAYFRQLLGYLPKGGESISLSNMLKMPGFLFVAASFLDKCDSLVHRSLRSVTTLGPSSNNFNAGESANLAMGAKPKVLELAHRRLVSTALEIVGGSPRLPEDPEPIQPDAAARRHYFGPLLVVWVRAITKRTSMWDTRSVFLLLDFLDGLFYTLLYTVPFGLADDDDCPPRLDPTGLPLFDLPFIRDVLKRILTSADNTVCVMRTIAFVYSQFEALTSRPADCDALCVDLLLEPAVFEHLFLHWNSGVRGYYLRLLVWRLSRLGITEQGQASKSPAAVKILLLFNTRLDAVRERHDELSPASDLLGIGDSETYRMKRSTICSTRGVSDQPWAIDELPRDDTPEVVEEASDRLDKAGGAMPKVSSWLKVVKRLGTGGSVRGRARGDLPPHSIQPFHAAPQSPELGISEEDDGADIDESPADAFSTPTRRSRPRGPTGSTNPDSPTFFKFEFELGADIPRSDAFDSPASPGAEPAELPKGAADLPVIHTPPPLTRRISDQGPALSPRVSSRFSKRASLLPPTALSMLRENSETVPPLPTRSRYHSLQDRPRNGQPGPRAPAYPDKKHAYAIRALAEYEQSLEEEHEWKEKVADDEENEGKPLGDLVPRLGVSWPLSFEEN